VVVDQRDLLALELVEATFLLAQVLDQDVGRSPVAAHQREVPLEHAAVLRGRQAVARGDQRDLVERRIVCQREGDADGVRVERRGALALQALVALHALVGGVAGLALFKGDLDAVDAAGGVDVLEIVLLAVGPGHAVGRIGAGAIGQQRNELLLGQGRRGEAGRTQGCERGGERERLEFHWYVSSYMCQWHGVHADWCIPATTTSARPPAPGRRCINGGRATGAASACPRSTASPGHAARRSGR